MDNRNTNPFSVTGNEKVSVNQNILGPANIRNWIGWIVSRLQKIMGPDLNSDPPINLFDAANQIENVTTNVTTIGNTINTIQSNVVTISGTVNTLNNQLNGVITPRLSGIGNEISGVSLSLINQQDSVFNLGNVSGTTILNLAHSAFLMNVVGNINLSFSGVVTSGYVKGIVTQFTNGGSYAIIWPDSVKFANRSAPQLMVSGTDHVILYSFDGGVNWSSGVNLKDIG